MLLRSELKTIAREKLKDAQALRRAKRYDSAIYLRGYAVEIALKARICQTLKWPGFPSLRKEFEGYQSLRTHDLEVLLHLSGVEDKIKTKWSLEWRVVSTWDPEMRYNLVSSTAGQNASAMIAATKVLLRVL